MIKTEMMKQYEKETGETLDMAILAEDASGSWYGYIDMVDAKAEAYDRLVSKTIMSDAELDAPLAQKILREMCEKAEAYDRLMSGGKKTLKEIANILGMVVGVNKNGIPFWSEKIPNTLNEEWGCWFIHYTTNYGDLPQGIVDFTGDWKDSLTLPDGWEKK